jgi:hypothetical protein
MPEELSDEELGIPEGLDPNIRGELRKSRTLARDNESKDRENANLQRELAFARAGLPDTPLVQTLAKSYDGENDPAAVRAYFEGLNVDLTAPGQQTAQELADLDAQRRIASVGSQGEPGGDVKFEDAIRSAPNQEAVMDLIRNAPEGATTWAGDGRYRRIGPPSID